MFIWQAKLRFKKLKRAIQEFGDVTPDRWPEYKSLYVEALKMAVKVETHCRDDIIYWNMLASFRQFQETVSKAMPVEYYADLFTTLRDLSREHNPAAWEMLEKIRDLEYERGADR